ncbi:MAG: hypothetical protein JJ59_00130 [Candidatus Micrarchaeum sp. AZ1]|jgi:glycosyltransferase involved in cell wall biosynthesis|nr:MAG: hypothetical protein JJ59_00130 [Candidatus Micrarchaeum sp. AZ1]
MKMAFVSDVVYPFVKGGVEATEYEEMKTLAKEHEVHVFCMRFSNMKTEFISDGIHYHAKIRADKKSFYVKGIRSSKEAARFALGLREMFKYEFDVVQANAFPLLHLPLVKLYCKLNKAKLMLDIAEVWDKEHWNKYIGNVKGSIAHVYNSNVLKGADFYIANSSVTKEALLKLGINPNKITVFTPFLNMKLISNVKVPKKSKSVIVAGRLIKEKRLDTFIEVMSNVIKDVPDAKGLIIGNGPEKNTLENMIHAKGLDKKIVMIKPYKEKLELYKAIKSSSVMLQMSEREGLSEIAIESIALGTPVILPDYTPIPKEVRDMCIVADEKEMPRLIAKALNGKGVYKKINKRNLKRYDIANINKYYSKIFKDMGIGYLKG